MGVLWLVALGYAVWFVGVRPYGPVEAEMIYEASRIARGASARHRCRWGSAGDGARYALAAIIKPNVMEIALGVALWAGVKRELRAGLWRAALGAAAESVVCLGWFWSVSDGTFLAHLKASTVQPLSLHRLDGERPRLSAKQQAGMLAGAFVFVAVSGVVSMLYFAREAAWTRDGACELRKAKAACRLRDGEVVVSGMPAVDMELERRVFFSMYQMDFLMRAGLLPLARIEAVIDDPHVGCLLTTDVATASRRIGSEDEISFMRVELGDSITRQFERVGFEDSYFVYQRR